MNRAKLQGKKKKSTCKNQFYFYTLAMNNLDMKLKKQFQDFRGGAVVKNPPANAGDKGSSPGPGRSHMPRSS